MFSGLKRQLSVFAPLGAGLLIITLLTALAGLWQYQYEVGHQSSAKALTGSVEAAALQKNGVNPASNAPASSGGPDSAQGQGTSSTGGSAGVSAAQQKTAPAGGSPANGGQVAAPASISVALSINGQAKGTVRLAGSSSQCDVLRQALAAGLIGSLDMRYSSQYNTEAVYVIDGVGDPGTVWWTYKVNGSPPPYGCAYMPAHNGDSVNWQYVKS